MTPRFTTVGLRLSRFAWAIGLLSLLSSHAAADRPKGLPIQLAAAYDAIKARAANEVEINGLKQIDEDFVLLAVYLKSSEYEKSKRSLLNRIREANLLPSKDEQQQLFEESLWLAALWLEWRHEKRVNKGEDLQTDRQGHELLSGALDKFAKVRIESSPPKATVNVGPGAFGKTAVSVYLSSDVKHHVKLTLDGYEDWEKKDYQPPKIGEKLEAELKKKDK